MSAPAAAPERFGDFDVERDYARLRGPLLGLLRRDGWKIADDEWDATWNAVCANVWRRQQVSEIDFRGEPLNYLLAAAKNELRRERRRPQAELVSLDADDAPDPSSPAPEPDAELDLRDKLRLAHTIARHRLRPRELRVWGLRIVCGLTYEEGAARMGIPPKRFEKELLSAHAKIADEIRAVASGTWCESTKGVSLMRAYEEGVLDPDGDALRELRDHARTCPACRRAMKAVEGIVPLMLPPAPVLLAATAPADGASIERKTHALAGLRRAAGELWHAVAGSPASAGAVQAGGEGGAAATASGIGLLSVAGGKAIAVCLTAATVGTCLTVAAVDQPASKDQRHHHHTARHAQEAASRLAPRIASGAAASTGSHRAGLSRRAPSLAHAAAASSRQRRLLRATSRTSSGAAAAPGGEFGGGSFESQSSGASSTASTASAGSGGGSGGTSSVSKPSGGEFSSGGFEK